MQTDKLKKQAIKQKQGNQKVYEKHIYTYLPTYRQTDRHTQVPKTQNHKPLYTSKRTVKTVPK